MEQFFASLSDLGAFGKVLEIIALNIVLSGDNAVEIGRAHV